MKLDRSLIGLAVCLIFLCTGCKARPSVVGEWVTQDSRIKGSKSEFLSVKGDGTFQLGVLSGDWKVTGEQIAFHATRASGKPFATTLTTDATLNFDGTELTMTNSKVRFTLQGTR